MIIHLAGVINQKDRFLNKAQTIPQQILVEEQYPASLVTYAYPGDIDAWHQFWRLVPKQHVIIDSGAFTAHSKGISISVEELCEFIIEFKKSYSYLQSTHFMTLDVKGDQAQTWKNFHRMQALGIETMPVLSGAQATLKDIDRAFEHEYIAAGNLVGGPACQKQILDKIFNRAMAYNDKHGRIPKIHLLGLTQGWSCNRYPAYSCDSSSWLAPFRYGHSRLKTSRKLPTYQHSAAGTAAAKEVVRREIKHYEKMMDDATKLWQRRGITWEK